MKSTEPKRGTGCQSGRWYEVLPRGYVCNDHTTTLDLEHPRFRALEQLAPNPDLLLPYRYAYSMYAPMYGRIPTEEEQARTERVFGSVDALPRNRKPRSGYEELATPEILRGTDPIPIFLRGGQEAPRMPGYKKGVLRKKIPAASLLSFTHAIDGGGRTFLLSTDMTLVPADRVRPFKVTKFRGTEIGSKVKLPLGWTRHAPRSKYERASDGKMRDTGKSWPARSLISLTGGEEKEAGRVYLEAREGVYIKASEISVLTPRSKLPFSVAADEKWIDFSIRSGLFTLYVGKNPVYTTLASPGAGGTPPSSRMTNEELVKGSHTPLGIYRVTFKTRATTMTPEGTPNPEKHWIADVPYTQYFRRPFAIHTAYWHEDFGRPKSGGCINLAPADARYLFEWTEPGVPKEWSGATSSKANGLGTKVVIRR